ncbi:hypothetical protein BX616_005751 [Lobosporangium transversale]|uniref:SEC7 domain-containing protein n=1 Tax=Lobosporangium transversale TaxID=64571 RepID=A0A1Y2GE65_9FUNG|nr:hypothetical protein BCR41DRAFT_341427 [Lobosporangium transversale]KAF9915607.1 hypothetical protein BX616_005751 [Lobosporangium transversale]ORZ05289.1 hypothetical protein BCR41DRAFT_341427 [Lobosporangium transversale]|eukprot:XP_021876981.1 hypothetical protein BCR41DRAFT_341427 [Lobosporangium transversale]
MDSTDTNTSIRRQPSTILLATAPLSLIGDQSSADTVSGASQSYNSTKNPTPKTSSVALKPPSSTKNNQSSGDKSNNNNNNNNNNRASIGLWSGSKTAASTPNLTNISKHDDFFGPYTLQGAVSGAESVSSPNSNPNPSFTSASESGAGLKSSRSVPESGAGAGLRAHVSEHSSSSTASSFQQRRKRSESIGGLKSTAGTISRMVRKSSSNLLRKLAKNFDDKDAPPIPAMPAHNDICHQSPSSSPVNSDFPVSNVTTPTSELPPLSAKSSMGFGTQDGLMSQEKETEKKLQEKSPPFSAPASSVVSHQVPISISKSSRVSNLDIEVDLELSTSASTVESWLKRQSDLGDIPTSTDTTSKPPITSSSLNTERDPQPSIGLRHPSDTSVASTVDEDDSESEDVVVPIPSALTISSNRLSQLLEAELAQSGKLSGDEVQHQHNNGHAPVKTALSANARNSIRFSEFGLMTSPTKEQPSTSLQNLFGLDQEKPSSRRPVSIFVPLGTPTNAVAIDGHLQTPTHDIYEEIPHKPSLITPDSSVHSSPALIVRRSSDTPEHETPQDHNISGLSLSLPVTGSGMRPATICVSPKDANKLMLTKPSNMGDEDESLEAQAQRSSRLCFKEDESFLKRDEISIFLGQAKPFNRMVLTHYMNNFDFSGKRLDVAFRQLCQKLVLKGETQEVDRVLEGFAQRYVDCNPRSIFGTKDVVHAISYSILLLNTDLHVVQQSSSSKMSRSAFVKNTLQVVQAQTLQQQQMEERASEDSSIHGTSFARTGSGDLSVYGGIKKRTPSVKSWKSSTSHQSRSSKMGADPKANGGHGNGKWWMGELESLLKDIYSAVKHNQILLPSTSSGISSSKLSKQAQSSATPDSGFGFSLGGGAFGLSHQAPANLGNGSLFGAMGRRNSLNVWSKQLRQEAIQRPNSQIAENGHHPSQSPSTRYSVIPESSMSSSKETFPASLTPPTSSSRPIRLMSSPLPSPVLSVFSNHDTQSIQPITASSSNSDIRSHPGHQARYRMEGILHRKHLLERADRKASHRAWRQFLVVLDQGGLSMFKADGQQGQAFDEQGVLLDEIPLQHTITNILPPPGYSSSRRHVFAVQLHTGGVYLFQTATTRDCEDWARTCNYWAARTSKEPLQGGVVNMDYGWGRSLDLLANSNLSEGLHSNTMASTTSVYSTSSSSSATNVPNGGVKSSSSSNLTPIGLTTPSSTNSEDEDAKLMNSTSYTGSSNFLNNPPLPVPPPVTPSPPSSSVSGVHNGNGSHLFGSSGSGSGRASSIKSTSSKHSGTGGSGVPLGDRVLLFEWTSPLPTMSMSQLSEEDQCENLKRYVLGLEAEMEIHQEHRGPMLKLFLPKSQNYSKAFNNWERRSRYLLKEMVKYQIYVECLEQSLQLQRDAEAAEAAETETLKSELQYLDVDNDEDE